MTSNKRALIFGATGNVGGATSRELLNRGWHIRAVTRNPDSDKSLALKKLGAEIFEGDMGNRSSLEASFKGFKKVFSIQNPWISGVEGEVQQGKLVGEIAKEAGVNHFVFSSAGFGEDGTGISHFQNKVEIENHLRTLGLPTTIIRPGPFMELLVNKDFFPSMSTWGAEPKVLGWHTPKPWVAVRDIGIATADIFENPNNWIGREIILMGDVKTLAECKELLHFYSGKRPLGIPIPVKLFEKIVNKDLVLMWEWMANMHREIGDQGIMKMVEESRVIFPDLQDIESWLEKKYSNLGNKN